MPNNLNALIPVVITSLRRVLRQTGAVFNAFTVDAQASAAAVGQTVDMPETRPQSTYDITPAHIPPILTDVTVDKRPLVIEQYKGARFHLTGEDWRAIGAQGPDFRGRQIDECIAALIHEAAQYAFGVADAGAGRAIGAAGTAPFATSPNILTTGWKILTDYLAPQVGRVGILSTDEWAGASNLPQFQKASEAPAGVQFNTLGLGTLANFMTSFDQAIGVHESGTGTGYEVDGATAAGLRTLTLKTGTGTILPGDVVHFGTDTDHKYVVESLDTLTLTLRTPLLVAVADDADVTIAADHRANLLCHPDAYAMAIRAPAEAPDGDSADAVQVVSDPVTGLAMRLAHYRGYHAGQWELSFVYGAAPRRPELAVKLIA